MPRMDEVDLAKNAAEEGAVGFFSYKKERLQLKVHYNSVFLDEQEALGLLLNCIINGREVFGKKFGLELVEFLEYHKSKEDAHV